VSARETSGQSHELRLHPAILNLRDCQRQLDFDGVDVGVSRQALDETMGIIGELIEALRELDRWVTEDSDCRTQAQRQAGRKALIAARAALAKASGSEG
jgi:hypothetical protein